jgi:hypothetical protein
MPGRRDNRLGDVDPSRSACLASSMAKKMRCLIGWHKFVRRHNAQAGDSNAYYWQCAFCGKERDVPSIPSAPM